MIGPSVDVMYVRMYGEHVNACVCMCVCVVCVMCVCMVCGVCVCASVC